MDFEQWLQSRLTAHGYPVGRIDGVIGTKTIAALRAFQRGKSLPITGQADAATVAALKRSSSNAPGTPERPASTTAGVPSASGPWPRQSEVERFYGPVGTSQGRLQLPFPMKLAWDKRRIVTSITLHTRVLDSAGRAFAEIASTYSDKERRGLGLDLFGGSLNVRRMRGGSAYSMHSWGIAIDFDPERNQLRWKSPKARLSHTDAVPFWLAWERESWVSLGRERNFDWMHVQAARL
jgi:peptidoglycan hydrolase-like protein with peptidoglycan-binding domain